MIEVPSVKNLKDDFNIMAVRFSNEPDALRRVLMVGALLDPANQARSGLSISDEIHLIFALKACSDLGLKVRSDFSLAIQNREYGHDFLKHQPQTDLVIFGHIYSNPNSHDQNTYTRQSDLAHQAGVWHRSLMATGATHAVNIHANGPELPTGSLALEPYRLLHTHRGSTGMQYDILKRS